MSKSTKLPKIVVIIGPTASGKTALGIDLCRRFNGEIVSADSRQVYSGMDIGTGKDLPDYELGGAKVDYHLIDVANPDEQFDVAQYQQQAYVAIDDILSRGKLPIIVGGSGLYLQAVVDGYNLSTVRADDGRSELEQLDLESLQQKLAELNPLFFERLNNSDRNNPRRLVRYIELASVSDAPNARVSSPHYDCLLLGLDWPLEILQPRIKKRITDRLAEQNMVGEVEGLNAGGLTWARLDKFGLEYRWIARYLQGKLPYETMVESLYRDTCRFAKRQLTWFKRWQRQGAKIHWLTGGTGTNDAEKLVEEFIKKAQTD